MNEHDALICDVEDIIETQIRPLLKIHGGGITLERVSEKGEVALRFEGACRGCMLKSVTYALGVRQKLMQHPGVTNVAVEGVRISDHAIKRVEKFYSGYSFWVGDPLKNHPSS